MFPPAQNVFSSTLPGESGLDFDMCWRCPVQSKLLNFFFFGTSLPPKKAPTHQRGPDPPLRDVRGRDPSAFCMNQPPSEKKKRSSNSKHMASQGSSRCPRHVLTTWFPWVPCHQTPRRPGGLSHGESRSLYPPRPDTMGPLVGVASHSLPRSAVGDPTQASSDSSSEATLLGCPLTRQEGVQSIRAE